MPVHRRSSTPDGLTQVHSAKSGLVPSFSFPFPDFSDMTSWWGGSQRATGEVLSSGDGLTYSFAQPVAIDVHRRIGQRVPTPGIYDPADYALVVRRNGVDISGDLYGHEPGATAADKAHPFTFDAGAAAITFDTPQTGQVIEVDYSYPQGYEVTLRPPAGETWIIAKTEAQFSKGHPPWGSPVLLELGLDAVSQEVPVAAFQYNHLADVIDVANFAPSQPVAGTCGLTQDVQPGLFDYLSGFALIPPGAAPEAIEGPRAPVFNWFRVRLKYPNPIPQPCEIASATLYIEIVEWRD